MALNSLYPEPYPIEFRDNRFYFSTDYGARYVFYFGGERYFENTPYSKTVFSINLIQEQEPNIKPRPTKDLRIEATVIDLLEETINGDSDTIFVYYCSQLKNKQEARARYFKAWMEKWNEWRGNNCELLHNASNKDFSACIFLRVNPYNSHIKRSFIGYTYSKQ